MALMLGNKREYAPHRAGRQRRIYKATVLDSDTYTNITWANVTLISVHEIYYMEHEFLSNPGYSGFVSREDWEEWLIKLSKYGEYCERAQWSLSPAAKPDLVNQ
jgi:hypothetical protein